MHNTNKNKEKNFIIFSIKKKTNFEAPRAQNVSNLFFNVQNFHFQPSDGLKKNNRTLYKTQVSSHLKRFGNRMKIDPCASSNVRAPPLTTWSGPRLFILKVVLGYKKWSKIAENVDSERKIVKLSNDMSDVFVTFLEIKCDHP